MKSKIKQLQHLLIVLNICLSVSANEFHGTKSRNEKNPGTADSPFITIQAAANLAQPGDVITVCRKTNCELVNPPCGTESDAGQINPYERIRICCAKDAGFQEQLAAKELRRYIYLRTGELCEAQSVSSVPVSGDLIVVAENGSELLNDIAFDVVNLAEQEYIIKTIVRNGRKVVLISGGDSAGVLYGAYHFIEKLGVQFQLDDDVIPDKQIPFELPKLDETHQPVFEVRGIQPFHDFPQGPDWWSKDDYIRYITGLARMRMNFIGFHCYPPNNNGTEPLIWIGNEKDFNPVTGEVKRSYQTYWANTGIISWRHSPINTSDFTAGMNLLFDKEQYGSPVFDGIPKRGQTQEQSNEVFNRVGIMLNKAFSHARNMGVKTCVGTQTPLASPNPGTKGLSKKEIFRGIFGRIKATSPLDYYWIWTPEPWTLHGSSPQEFEVTVNEIKDAEQALEELGNPFKLATCGWVLGPANDRAGLDKILDKSITLSSINRNVGHQSIDPAYDSIKNRPKWAIPWLENDPNMVGPQPWVGRMRRDAADAKHFGCTGLLGIHWRTSALSQNIPALAQAGWDQSWSDGISPEDREKYGSLGGHNGSVVSNRFECKSLTYGMEGHRFAVPNGSYRVTLIFIEPHYNNPGKRVFDVTLQGKKVLENLDIFARVGKNSPLDLSFDNIRVDNGKLEIGYKAFVDLPAIAAIKIEGTSDPCGVTPAAPYQRFITCGSYTNYQWEACNLAITGGGHPRTEPVDDFYHSWATARFGAEAGPEIGAIMAELDGVNFPEISVWQGPGWLNPVTTPWQEEQKRYTFVDELERLRGKVYSPGNRDRFDYWLNTYRYTREAAHFKCAAGKLNRLIEQTRKAQDAERKALAEQALETRIEMARLWENMLRYLIPTVKTPGDLATMANLEQLNRMNKKALSLHDDTLKNLLGVAELPEEATLNTEYRGQNLILVPTRRSLAKCNETLSIPVLLPSENGVKEAHLKFRAMGSNKKWKKVPLKHIARAVYHVDLPLKKKAVEYNISATFDDGQTLIWPASAPTINKTVVVHK